LAGLAEDRRQALPQHSIQAKQHRIQWAELNGPGAKKCMALNRIGRVAMATSLSVAMGLGVTACSHDYTVGYVYMTTASANPGLVNGYKVDFQAGTLVPLEDSPIPAGGKNPVALVVAPNGKSLYVVNRDDSTVVWFAIGTDGKLYPQVTYDTTGSFPTAATIDPAGNFLYVTFTYQKGYTTALPGPGGITVYPIDTSGNQTTVKCSGGTPSPGTAGCLGAPSTVNAGRNPVGISASNTKVYVIDQDPATTQNLLGYATNSGSLTPLQGVTINAANVPSTGFAVGSMPAAVIQNPALTRLYVTDQASNQVIGYSLDANGIPTQVGSAATDSGPVGMTIEASGTYLYVANSAAGTISGYTFGSNGQPVVSAVAKNVQSGTGTNCVTTIGAPSSATPTHAIYLYASNSLSNTVTGEQLNPADGSLRQIQGTPFGGSTLPTCIVSAPSFPR
jgi:DNA-binding beta-propeller fold protein YncE